MKKIYIALLLLASISSNNVFAQPGTLDATFGINGKVTTAIGSGALIRSITLQSDGKIVAGGYTYNGSNADFALARYKTTGLIDSTFGTNGIVSTAFGSWSGKINSMALQSDGKIVAGGYSYNTSSNSNYAFTLGRYKTTGIIDSTFGTNGIVTTAIGSFNDYISSIALQSDGKIVAGGASDNGSNNDFALARYNANGTLDNTFGTNGIVITAIGSAMDEITSIALQSDGKIVAGGYSYNGSNYDFTLARYTSIGSLDNTFGTSGIITTAIGSLNSAIYSIILQSDGKIVAGGYTYFGYNYAFALARYKTTGIIDNSFGTNGIVSTAISSADDRIY